MLTLGLGMLFRPGKHLALARGLSLFLVFQFLLHLLYGDFPFLYSAHFLPVFVLLMGLPLTGAGGLRLVLVARILAVLYVVSALPLNLQSFRHAVDVAGLLVGS